MIDVKTLLMLLSVGDDLARELNKILKSEINGPNIPFPTMGGKVFWNTLVEVNGWKLQQNMFTHHARILNDKNVRIAWGTIEGMEKAMDQMLHFAQKYQNNM